MAQVLNSALGAEFMCAQWPAAGLRSSASSGCGLHRGRAPPTSRTDAAGPTCTELTSWAAGGASSSSSQRISLAAAVHTPPATVNFCAGLIAGLAVDVPLHPLDTVKTRLQAPNGLMAAGGFRGLWRGLTPVLLRSLPCGALFFTSYEQTRRLLEGHVSSSHSLPLWCDALAGASANTVACAVRVPCEVLKQHMQAQGAKSVTLSETARRVGSLGLRGFYQGFSATLHREAAFAMVQMPLFEYLKQRHPWNGDSSRGKQGVVGMTCGGAAGALAGAVTTPFDVAKTQIMLSPHRCERGISVCLAEIYAQGGLRALFCGALPRTVYVGASCMLSFGAFEWSRSLLWAPGQA